jgi:sterol desaturase/sphingolipid hydroxylase (fatty acid hydroxylase superfamily)
MASSVIAMLAGLFAWTLVEYAIHGWLSHRFRTFASPLHAVHHRDPHAVFAVGAWIPVAVIYGALLAYLGWTTATAALTGLVAGFAGYEALHYRFHFARPASRWEARLRARHLAHHVAAPDALFGVTTALWDRAFGSAPGAAELTRLCSLGAAVPPLDGASNARLLLPFRFRARRPAPRSVLDR